VAGWLCEELVKECIMCFNGTDRWAVALSLLMAALQGSAAGDVKVAQITFSGTATPSVNPIVVRVVPRDGACDGAAVFEGGAPIDSSPPATQVRDDMLDSLQANAPPEYQVVAFSGPGGAPGIEFTANEHYDICAGLGNQSLTRIVGGGGLTSVTTHGITITGLSKTKSVTGACCQGTACEDNVAEGDCPVPRHFHPDLTCEQLSERDCPALSWAGMLVAGLLVSVAGAVIVRRRPRMANGEPL